MMTIRIGIDWSEQKHDLVFLNEAGSIITHLSIPHRVAGFQQIDETRMKLGVTPCECIVGLETAHNLLIDYLWSAGYQEVYVVVPNIVNKSRARYRQSGANDDQSDAYVIADLLRTDLHRFYPWRPGSPLLQQMRAATSLGQFLTKQTVSLSNRLRAVLQRYYPAALQVFRSWPSSIVCHFVMTYPTPEIATSLTWEEFKTFAQTRRHPKPRTWLACYDRLQANYPRAAPAVSAAYKGEAVQLAQMLLDALQNKRANLSHLQALFQQHPDRALFHSLPGAGDFLAPALLAKFGEDRKRFPLAMSVQTLAGTCPVTKRSGKFKVVRFRRACDREFRHIAQQFALTSRAQSDWANTYYHEVFARCHAENHALRCLANRWLAIIWKMWQSQQPYDESYHLKQRAAHRRPLP